MTTVTATLQHVPILLSGYLLAEIDDVECEITVGARGHVKSVIVDCFGTAITVTWETPGDAVAGIMDRAQDWIDAHWDQLEEARQEEIEYRHEVELDRRVDQLIGK